MDELNENTLGKFKNKALAMDDDSDDNEEEELPVVDETPKEVNLTQSKRPSPFDKKRKM